MLCHTMTDIDDLLKHFVVEKIISFGEEEKIKNCVKKSEKVRNLLLNISGPLEAGDSNGFYVLLRIMEDYGTRATQALAIHMKSRITDNYSSNKGKVSEESPESEFLHASIIMLI